MKEACVFLFSGTGMTKYVIDKIQSELENQKVFVDIYYIESTMIQNVSFNDYDILGIAYPVHSFNAPKIVINFANRLPKMKTLNTFIISTAGEHNSLNFSSSKLLINILRKKGFDVFYDKQFIMPSNFVVKYDESKVNRLIDNANAEIPKAVHDIINLVSSMQQISLTAKLMSFIGRVEWFGSKCIGKFFYADKKCNRCGICARNCPNHNIIMSKSYACFKWQCGLCMRCLYLCPTRSIKVHHPFKFITFSDWYENHELSMSAQQTKGGFW